MDQILPTCEMSSQVWGSRMSTIHQEATGAVLTVREAAAELKCSGSFVYKLMKIGELAFERRGRRKLPLAHSIADYRLRSLVQSPVKCRTGMSPKQPTGFRHLFTN